ncbi:MAG TPA: Ref family recombination enhancement nuclease [Pseudomonas sp.]
MALKRTPLTRRTPLASAPKKTKRQAPAAKKSAPSMKGVAPSAAEKRFHDQLAGLGCIACRIDGNWRPEVSIHHIDGRTKPGAHKLVLPLCDGHHQDGTGPDKSMVAVHPWKARFQEKYGHQLELLERCKQLLIEQGVELECET